MPTAGGAATRVQPNTVQRNMPKQLVFLNPDGLNGTFYLEVRARMGHGAPTRELRIGRLDGTLTVMPE